MGCLYVYHLETFLNFYIISETDIILQIFVVPIANLFDFFQFISLNDSSFSFVTFKINTNCQHHSWKFSFEATIIEVTYFQNTRYILHFGMWCTKENNYDLLYPSLKFLVSLSVI